MVKKTKRHVHRFGGEGEKVWTEITNFKRNQLWIQGRRKFRPTINPYKIIFYERSTFSSNHKRSIYSNGCQISCSGIWLNLKGILFIMCEFLSSIRNADHLRAFGDFDMKSSTPNRWFLQFILIFEVRSAVVISGNFAESRKVRTIQRWAWTNLLSFFVLDHAIGSI